jgi:hypothetical protein
MYLDGYRNEIVLWVQQRLSDQAIADRVRVSARTVRYWRQRNGVTRPAKQKRPPPRDKK